MDRHHPRGAPILVANNEFFEQVTDPLPISVANKERARYFLYLNIGFNRKSSGSGVWKYSTIVSLKTLIVPNNMNHYPKIIIAKSTKVILYIASSDPSCPRAPCATRRALPVGKRHLHSSILGFRVRFRVQFRVWFRSLGFG